MMVFRALEILQPHAARIDADSGGRVDAECDLPRGGRQWPKLRMKPAIGARPSLGHGREHMHSAHLGAKASQTNRINEWLDLHADSLGMAQPRCNYNNKARFHAALAGGVEWR